MMLVFMMVLIPLGIYGGILLVHTDVIHHLSDPQYFSNPDFAKNIAINSMEAVIATLLSVFVVCILIYLAVAYTFSSYFVYFKNYGAWEALEASRKVVSKKWFSFFVFFIVILLINLAWVLYVFSWVTYYRAIRN